jgi:hypothetical protein
MDEPIQSQIEIVTSSSLSDTDRKVLESYYSNKWSVFTESCLTNDDKVQLIASALFNSVYDDYAMESVHNLIRYKLDEAIKSGLRINRMFDNLK